MQYNNEKFLFILHKWKSKTQWQFYLFTTKEIEWKASIVDNEVFSHYSSEYFCPYVRMKVGKYTTSTNNKRKKQAFIITCKEFSTFINNVRPFNALISLLMKLFSRKFTLRKWKHNVLTPSPLPPCKHIILYCYFIIFLVNLIQEVTTYFSSISCPYVWSLSPYFCLQCSQL